MTTNAVAGASTFPVQGSSALQCSFDPSKLTALVANRNSRFHLDLSNSNLVEVLEAKQAFSRKISPRYSLQSEISLIQRLQDIVGQTILPIDITDDFLAEAQKILLTTEGDAGKVLTPSTITTYFSAIQGALNWASRHNCQISETFNSWRLPNYEKPKVALDTSMIAHIYYFDLDSETNRRAIKAAMGDNPLRGFSFEQMQRAKDQLIIGCQIGQRYSDASRFDESNFDETRTIFHIVQQKTGNRAVVNLSKWSITKSICFEILNRYNYRAPAYGMDINNVNKYLHLLCRVIGREFNRVMVGENKINGEIVSEHYKAWQLVSTHTARRSFITHWARSKDISIAELQRCTGHADVRQLNRYTILTDTD